MCKNASTDRHFSSNASPPSHFEKLKPKKNPTRARNWELKYIEYAVFTIFVHVLCLFAPSTFSWDAAKLALVLYVVTGFFGITFSYHRNLTHRSFKLPKYLEYAFAYCGFHGYQGDPILWVSTHRTHHEHADTGLDPHSPVEGFWYGYIGYVTWFLNYNKLLMQRGNYANVADLTGQPFYRFLEKTLALHVGLMGALLYTLGGFTYVVWGMGVKTVCSYHLTSLVNSAGHSWGHQAWNTSDMSKNIWWMSLFTFGDAWHNNHHAFEFSARAGLEWWQFDPTWYLIKTLELLGLATDINLPTQKQKEYMSFKSGINNSGTIAT